MVSEIDPHVDIFPDPIAGVKIEQFVQMIHLEKHSYWFTMRSLLMTSSNMVDDVFKFVFLKRKRQFMNIVAQI